MSKESKIIEGLQKLKTPTEDLFVATVKEVDTDSDTITVLDGHGIDYPDVRLKAIVEPGDAIIVYPSVGSTVIVNSIKENDLYVAMFSEVDTLAGKIKDTAFKIDAQGYEINQGAENLKKVTDDLISQVGKLCDEINKIVVSIGVSPNVPAITAIKTEITGSIKSRFNTILK